MTKRTMSLLALGLGGVFGSAFACGDAPMSMKDASVAKPAKPIVVAEAGKAAAAQATPKATASATVTTSATTPATTTDKAATTRH